jgi:DNA-binding SARP family transcriptional activator/TolB-like protein/Flp pilus assembly protein TadD
MLLRPARCKDVPRKGRCIVTAQPVIRLRLLGRFSAVVDGSSPVPLRIASKKGIGLLAYLALHPEHTASREKLATLLWGDRPDQQARLNLRQCILTLRNSLPSDSRDLFVLEGDAVGLRMELLSIDALEFRDLIRSNALDELERAVSLYSAALLCELDIESEDFAVWLQTARERFEADFARVVEACIDQRDASGQGQLAIRAAERLITIDPLREDWQRLLLRTVARHQGSDTALARARTFAALLKKELGIDPEPATSTLIERIERGEIEHAKPEIERETMPQTVDQAAIAVEIPASTAIANHHASSRPEHHSAWRPQQSIERIEGKLLTRLHPAVATSLMVLTVLAACAGLLYFAGNHLVPIMTANNPAADTKANMASTLPERSAIVVLPFVSPAGNETTDIAEQVWNEVINRLSSVPNLKVISQLTSREYRQQPEDLAAIGDRLGVRYALHGRVRTESGRLYLDVELIDIATRLQVWSDRLEEDQADLTVASSILARRLGRSLQVEVINFQAAHPSGAPSPKAEIDRLVAKGWAAIVSGQSAETLAESEAAFTEALRRDPERLGAMLGLAAHYTIAAPLAPPAQHKLYMAEADRLLTRVIERRPDWSPPYFYRGQLLAMQGDPSAAIESFRKTIALNPSFASGYALIGRMLTELGQPDAALENIEHAKLLSPKDPALPAWDVFAGQAEIERGNDAAALQLIQHATAVQPNNPFFHASLAAVFALTGDQGNAEAQAARFRELTPNLSNEQRIAALTGRWQPRRFASAIRLALTEHQ